MILLSTAERLRQERVGERQFSACRDVLGELEARLARSSWSTRRRIVVMEQCFTLLQFLTISSERTLFDATPEDVEAWLAPSRGFAEHDVRVHLLGLLAEAFSNPALRRPPQGGSTRVRSLGAAIFWRDRLRRIHARSRPLFDSITQAEILASERRCEPFYRALRAVYPDASGTGVFAESDEVVVSAVRKRANLPQNIADIGCGAGRLLRRLGKVFPSARLFGTSIFPFSDDEARALEAARVTPVLSTASETGLPDSSQDVVVSTEVIEHLRHPEDMVREIHRILKPGGVFCVTAPSAMAHMYARNPLSYLAVAFGTRVPSVLPPFHDLYAPLAPLRIVHHAFHPRAFRALFASRFADVTVTTTRFTALRKFRLDKLAPGIPVLAMMGGLCVAVGAKGSSPAEA